MTKRNYMIFVIMVIISIPIMAYSSGIFQNYTRDIVYEKAQILEIVSDETTQDPVITDLLVGTQQLKIKMLSGQWEGEEFYIKNSLSRLYNVNGNYVDKIIVRIALVDGNIQNINVFNYNRWPILAGIMALFSMLLVVIGRKNGLRALLSLVFTGSVIAFVMLPKIFAGSDPIIMSVITVVITTIVSLILVSSWSRKTLSAIIGTISGVVIAGVIAYVAGHMAFLSGVTMSEAEELMSLAGDTGLKVRGLMFSAILIASLGAVMDVAMSISSSVFEFKSIDKTLGRSELVRSGMNVGKDVMGTMANTLILAFAGGSLNIMILIMAYKMSFNQMINLDLIGTEMILSFAGSIGIVLTVPITAFVAAVIATYDKIGQNIALSNKKIS